MTMRRLGKGNSAQRRRSGKLRKLPSRVSEWTVTEVSGTNTPYISLSGAVRATVITLVVDNAADWSGDATDYSLTGATVNNTTDGTSVSGQTFSFANDGGASGGGRTLTTGNNNFQSLVGAGSGETITVTGNLTRTGYESVEVTASTTY